MESDVSCSQHVIKYFRRPANCVGSILVEKVPAQMEPVGARLSSVIWLLALLSFSSAPGFGPSLKNDPVLIVDRAGTGDSHCC